MPAAQPLLPSFKFSSKLMHGGSRIKVNGKAATGNAKTARPVDTKRALHIVLKSSRATGSRSLLVNGRKIENTIRRQAKLAGIRLYDSANAGNHLHLVVRPRTRRALQQFLRASTGLVARIATGAERGKALHTKFWDALPFSRIVSWGRDYENLRDYLTLNRSEMFDYDRLTLRLIIAEARAYERRRKLSPIGFGTKPSPHAT